MMNEKRMFSLNGKTALVTDASHGIGFAVACELAYAGASIGFCCRDEQDLVDGMTAFEDMGIQAHGWVCDPTDEKAVSSFVNAFMDLFGAVDILVNTIEIRKMMPMVDMRKDELCRIMDANLIGPFMMSKSIIPGMVGLRGGKIINICAMAEGPGDDFISTYVSAKNGLKLLTKNIASEYGKYNIQCNGLCPGCVSHEMKCSLYGADCAGQAKEAEGWGTWKNFLGPALFLAEAASDHINGQIFYVDGGNAALSAESEE